MSTSRCTSKLFQETQKGSAATAHGYGANNASIPIDLLPINAILTGPHWIETDCLALTDDPTGFRLAAEITRIRLAYTHDPQFAILVAHIDPRLCQLEAVYYYMLRQPRLHFLLADDPGVDKTVMASFSLFVLPSDQRLVESI